MTKITLILILLGFMCSNIYAQCPPNNDTAIHIVQEKETLYGIAQQHNISVKQICEWNSMTAKDVIEICQSLHIQAPDADFFKKSGIVIYQKQGEEHVVQEGETLEGIAKLYGYTEEKFKTLNHLVSSVVVAGMRLKTSTCKTTKETTSPEPPLAENHPEPFRPNVPDKLFVKKSATNISPKGMAMLNEINLLRSNPKAYIPYIRAYVHRFQNTTSVIPSATVNELIQELEQTPALSTLKYSDCVYEAARLHGEELQRRQAIDHTGNDGATPWDRIKGCGTFDDGNENFVWGSSSVRDLVILLLLDNGTENRGHRQVLLHPAWTHGACYPIEELNGYSNFWIQDFAH